MILQHLLGAFRGTIADWNTVRAARLDGGCDPPIPHWNAEQLPPHCWRRLYRGMGTLQHTAQLWLAEDSKLLPQWDTTFREAGHADEQVIAAEEDLRKAEVAFKSLHQDKDAPPTDRRYHVYWFVTGLWSFLEVPFTAVAFRCLGDSDLLTYVVTLALSIAIVAGGHFLGATLRNLVKVPDASDKFNRALVLLLASVNIAVLLGVAFFRARYLSRSTTPPVPPPLGSHGLDAISTTATQAAPIGDIPALIIFFAFGLLLFVNVAVFAFRRHDPSLDAVFRRRRNLKKALKHRSGLYRQLARAKARREKRHGHYQSEAEWGIASVKSVVELYKMINLQTRMDRGQHEAGYYPVCFDKHGKMTVPECLTGLQWATALAAPTTKNISASATDTAEGGTEIADPRVGTSAAGDAIPRTLTPTLGAQSNGRQPDTTPSRT